MTTPRASTIRELSGARRVMIVDDQADSAELIGMLLEDEGHQIGIAHEGEAALSLALTFRPQVALLDISLPGMDGCELARRLRANPETAACRLIALSGHCDERDYAQSIAAGFEVHLSKPVDMLVLSRTINGTPGALNATHG